ncbi:quinone oxidoreductase family protein [Modestobacter versicolor]|uniref:NADPH2:quinone reductase n=1 Tax=Modestobacter versicolor TaxID=429133 RepID=A0A323V7X0_9ACTN|nr:zinc-binding dehydrogenase [Modestobacter versicolor]MBB3674456.1 NADPH2:quinone reductase [Modestobacter versicolor]PZA20794.1 zinc-binding alcohol dehydrogenase family protein [Modestobacter versicolor]
MDAAVLPEPGTPVFTSFDEPAAGPGQVVVDVRVAGVNPVDVATAAGAFVTRPPFPSVAGREGVGTVEGRRVYFNGCVAPFGAMAQRTVVPADSLLDVPEQLEDGLAVAMGIAGLAAWLPLQWRARLQPGETVLVLGASGVLGQIAVQAAKVLGAGRVVAAARDAGSLQRLADLGADATVDLSGEPSVAELAERIRTAADGGVDVTIDPVWGVPALAAMGAARRGMRHVQIGHSAAASAELAAGGFRESMVDLLGYTTRHVPRDVVAAGWVELTGHAAAGRIAVEVERAPLADVARVWQRQVASAHRKLVLVP